MSIANIVHSGYGFRCTATDRALPLTLGLDGSAVLLGRDGELYDKVMKRCRISQEEVDQALRCADCDKAQGFMFSRPVDKDAAFALLHAALGDGCGCGLE